MPLVGQNLECETTRPGRKSVLFTTKYNALFMAGVMLLFLLFASPIISIFTNNPEVHAWGFVIADHWQRLYFYGIGMVMIQALNGAGDTRTPTWINFLASGCSRYRLLSCWAGCI